jgi:hypothetical protein
VQEEQGRSRFWQVLCAVLQGFVRALVDAVTEHLWR